MFFCLFIVLNITIDVWRDTRKVKINTRVKCLNRYYHIKNMRNKYCKTFLHGVTLCMSMVADNLYEGQVWPLSETYPLNRAG